VLRHAHGMRIFHHDLKPHNMFKDDDSRIILNDRSSAAFTGMRVPWAGTTPFYDHREVVDVEGAPLPQPEERW